MLLAGENDDFQVVQFWEDVSQESVQTPQDVFARIVGEENCAAQIFSVVHCKDLLAGR